MHFTLNCITLATVDLISSYAFYTGLGLKSFDGSTTLAEGADHFVLKLGEHLSLVVILRKDFTYFTDIADVKEAKAGRSESVFTYFATTKEEVDEILGRINDLGGKVHKLPKAGPFVYRGYFTDPDKHLWEVLYNEEMLERLQKYSKP